MDSSFLTFSPKALLKKKSAKNPSGFRMKLAKTKHLPLQDLCSPSSLKNVSKNRISPLGSTSDSSIIILEEFTPSYDDGKIKKKRNDTISYRQPTVSKCDQDSYTRKVDNTICLDDSNQCDEVSRLTKFQFNHSTPNEKLSENGKSCLDNSSPQEKFESIKQWLEELGDVHQQKMYQPVWSTPSLKTVASSCSELSSVSGGKSSKVILETSSDKSVGFLPRPSPTINGTLDKDTTKKGRISESISDDSIQLVSSRNRKILFCDSDSNSNESNFLPSNLKSKLKIVSSDSDSDIHKNSTSPVNKSSSSSKFEKSRSFEFILPDSKRNAESKSRGSSEDVSDSSASRVLSELYGRKWDKGKVLTPKLSRKVPSNVRNETMRNSVTSVDDLLNTLYGESWCKEKVLTPQVNKTNTKHHVKGKENTPPVNRHLQVMKKCGISTPEIPSKSSKTGKCANIVSNSAQVPKTLSFLRSLSASPATNICNPKAVLYKREFKKKKEDLCFELFKLYNSDVFDNKLPSDMKIEWNARMNRTAGFCYNSWKVQQNVKIRSSRIELATKVCTTPDRVRDTLIHELCHAASWIVDGVKAGHGAHWKVWTNKAMKKFPELPNIKTCHAYRIETKFTYKCKNCGYSIGRHSKSLDLQRKRCGYCYGEFELLHNVKSKVPEKGLISTPRTPRVATGFALFVKENYKRMKEKHSTLAHAEIMKLLGNDYASAKRVASEQI